MASQCPQDTVWHANKPSSVLPQTWASILCFALATMGMGGIGADLRVQDYVNVEEYLWKLEEESIGGEEIVCLRQENLAEGISKVPST